MANIFKEAKKVQRLHPSWDWQHCIQVASKRHKKVGAVKRSKNRQTGSSNKAADKKRSARPPGPRVPAGGRKVTYTERRKNRSDVPGTLTGMSTGRLLAEAKRRIREDIDKKVVKKFHASTKRDRKKYQKEITESKAKLRRLQ